MNNINCEHCGALIDVEKDIKCPNCGAPYKNNKQYKEYKDYQKKQKDIELEAKQMAIDITKDVHNVGKKVIPGASILILTTFIIIIVAFIFIFSSIFSSLKNESNNNNIDNDYQRDIEEKIYNDIINNNNDDNNNNEEDDYRVSVLFNETAYTDQYNIKVNKVKKYTEKNFANNKTYYGFNVVFKNKTTNWQTLNNIKLTYTKNGKKETISRSFVSTKSLTILATEKKTYEGYIYFDIPNDVKNVTITYEKIDITINNYKDRIK